MADEDQNKILGFTKREAEILIMSIQVIKPNPCTTNGCTARPADLIRIGAYSDAETARANYAALRARVMTLPALPKPATQAQTATAATTTKDEAENDKAEIFAFEGGAGQLGGEFKGTNQPNPFLLTEEEKKLARDRALGQARGQAYDQIRARAEDDKRGEGVVDDDMPTEEEWEGMGDLNAW